MGASPTPRNAEPDTRARLAVAVSGGRDSTALLHCVARQALMTGVDVLALHVHHGLMPQADEWLDHLRKQCARWRRSGLPIRLHVRHLDTAPPAGESIEAWAREARYAALSELAQAQGCSVVLLAHHQEDQAETFLLQALRGGAPRGLASMPKLQARHGVLWLRPWLTQPRRAIDAYLARHRLRWVDDPSNAQPRFARSRLRRQVWPVLVRSFPDAAQALSLAAKRAHESSSCLRELADLDLMGQPQNALQADLLLNLTGPRLANALRHGLPPLWGGQAVPQSLIERLCIDLPSGQARRWPAPGGGDLCLHDGGLCFVPSSRCQGPVADAILAMDLTAPGVVALPNGRGLLTVRAVDDGGVALPLLASAQVHARTGGEQFQFTAAGTPRSLKKQFQARRVPAWAREGPLVYSGTRLLFVAGLGVDARARADPGQAQRSLEWSPT